VAETGQIDGASGRIIWSIESIDFTADRLPVGETSTVVHEYMAHTGDDPMALIDYFHKDIMIRQMQRLTFQSVELLYRSNSQVVPLQIHMPRMLKIITLNSIPADISPGVCRFKPPSPSESALKW
jgi:hypothetical protein